MISQKSELHLKFFVPQSFETEGINETNLFQFMPRWENTGDQMYPGFTSV